MSSFAAPSVPVVRPRFTASPYQEAIFDWVAGGSGHGLVLAVAGSGKTTTLVEAAEYLGRGDALFCAFNKHIQDELQQRLGGRMHCATIHSIGLRTLNNALPAPEIDADKYWNLSRAVLDDRLSLRPRYVRFQRGNFMRLLKATVDAVRYARLTLTPVKEAASLAALCAQFTLDIGPEEFSWWHELVREVLRQGRDQAVKAGVIDFEDMVWLPWHLKLRPPQYAWVFVDECQDLSAAQLDLVANSLLPTGRLLCVGDPRQAIYGFAGADAASIPRIQQRFDLTELPLSVTYRCPQAVVEVARLYAPQLEARPNVPAGSMRCLEPGLLGSTLKEGDLVLGRRTAPLVETCLELIAQHRPARVKGRGIGAELLEHLNRLGGRKVATPAELEEALDAYEVREIERLEKQANPGKRIAELVDQLAALIACIRAFPEAATIEALRRQIQNLFSDERAPITLSTVHRVKGLEAARVFIIYPHELPLTWPGQQPWEYEQELNLKYVAITRAKEELIWVAGTALTPQEQAARGLAGPAADTEPENVLSDLAAVELPETRWRTGQRVEHPHFGCGTIHRLHRSGATPMLSIAFDTGKTRMIVPTIAQLKLLE